MATTWLTAPLTPLSEADDPSPIAYSEAVQYKDDAPPTAKVTLKCKGDKIHDIAANILGNLHAWPYPSIIPMYATAASVKPMSSVKTGKSGDGGGINLYDWQLLDVQYGYVTLQGETGPGGASDPITETIK